MAKYKGPMNDPSWRKMIAARKPPQPVMRDAQVNLGRSTSAPIKLTGKQLKAAKAAMNAAKSRAFRPNVPAGPAGGMGSRPQRLRMEPMYGEGKPDVTITKGKTSTGPHGRGGGLAAGAPWLDEPRDERGRWTHK